MRGVRGRRCRGPRGTGEGYFLATMGRCLPLEGTKTTSALPPAVAPTTAACGQLKALINQAQAQSGKKLTVGQATAIITAAQPIRTALGCR